MSSQCSARRAFAVAWRGSDARCGVRADFLGTNRSFHPVCILYCAVSFCARVDGDRPYTATTFGWHRFCVS